MDESKLSHAKRNITTALALNILNMLLPFVVRTVFLYTIGVEYMGLNGLFTSVLSFLNVADLGIGTAIVYMLYKPVAENNTDEICALLRTCRRFYRIIGAVMLALGIAVIPFLPTLANGDIPTDINTTAVYLVLLINACMDYFMFGYAETLFNAHQRVDIYNVTMLCTEFARLLLQAFVLLAFRSYMLYCIVLPLIAVLKNLFVYRIARSKYPEYVCRGNISPERRKELSRQVFGLFISKISNKLTYDLDNIVVSSFMGLVLLAKYQNYSIIPQKLTTMVGIVGTSVIPGIGISMVKESREKTYENLNTYQMLYMWLNGWIVICMVVLMNPFICFWLGEGMLLSEYIPIVFGVYYISTKMNDVCFHYREAAGLWWQERHRAIFSGIFNCVMDIILVQYMGLTGVMVATILYQFVFDMLWGDMILFRNYFKEYSVKQYLATRLYYLATIATAGTICWVVCSYIPFDTERSLAALWHIIERGLICTVIANAIMLLAYRRLSAYPNAKRIAAKLIIRKHTV